MLDPLQMKALEGGSERPPGPASHEFNYFQLYALPSAVSGSPEILPAIHDVLVGSELGSGEEKLVDRAINRHLGALERLAKR